MQLSDKAFREHSSDEECVQDRLQEAITITTMEQSDRSEDGSLKNGMRDGEQSEYCKKMFSLRPCRRKSRECLDGRQFSR